MRLVQRKFLTNVYTERAHSKEETDARRGDRSSYRKLSRDFNETEESELLNLFCKDVAAELALFINEHSTEKLILIAGPKILGSLRAVLPATLLKGRFYYEVNKDYVHLPERELKAALDREQVWHRAARHFSRSPRMAWAVNATMGGA